MTDPEQIYQEVLQEEQRKGSSPAVAEGRAKAARQRALHGSPHPKEPKWWPGAQPQFEDGAAGAQAAGEAEAAPAEAPVPEEAPAPAEAVVAEIPAAAPAEEAAATQPAAAAAQAQPAAGGAPAAPARPTELPYDQRPPGVPPGSPGGTRLRPEDEAATDTQFEGQQAHLERRRIIDELVSTGVPAVTATEAGAPARGGVLLLLAYLLIPLLAIGFLMARDQGAPAASGGGEGGGGAGFTQSVTAEGSAFDTDTIRVPAGEPYELEFVNNDAVQHNIVVFAGSDASGEQLFRGELIASGSTTYSLPAFEPGEYYFHCEVHPGMEGTLVAGQG